MNLLAFLLLLATTCSSAFTVVRRSSKRMNFKVRISGEARNAVLPPLFLAKLSDDPDFPPESSEEYTGNVDWDAEWKKVVKNKDQPSQRPGTDYYKSEAEIAAIKTANKASEKVLNVATKVSDTVPTWQSVKGDWKFWVGVLAVVSIGISLISAAGQSPSTSDSFYI